MAFAPSTLTSNCSLRALVNDDTVTVYIEEAHRQHNERILADQTPVESFEQDQWDQNQIGDLMILRNNVVTFTGGPRRESRGNTAFLSKVVNRGVHGWRFKSDIRFCHWWCATIGIWKCSDDSFPPKNDIFTLGEHRAYGFNLSQGTLVNPQDGKVGKTPVDYGQICFGAKIIDMILDFDALELKFRINGIDYGKAFDIENTTYRAAVNLSRSNDSVQLLQYECHYPNHDHESISASQSGSKLARTSDDGVDESKKSTSDI